MVKHTKFRNATVLGRKEKNGSLNCKGSSLSALLQPSSASQRPEES